MDLNEKLYQAVWIAHSLFERGKTSGTTANISFLDDGVVWISRSGSCFGILQEEDFVPVSLSGGHTGSGNNKPSKELPLHLALYGSCDETQAVIHTHAPYSTLWSCLQHGNSRDVLPDHTPYLKMKLGNVVSVPYAPPGSEELFALMRSRVGCERGYLLANHGPIVAGKALMNAFEAIEELEQSAQIAWCAYAAGIRLSPI